MYLEYRSSSSMLFYCINLDIQVNENVYFIAHGFDQAFLKSI